MVRVGGDIAAAEVADPAASVAARRNSAAELIALGDPRGAGILISQILDHELTPFNRLEAARELSDVGDPRAPYLTADLCAQLVMNRRVNRLLRGAAWSGLDQAAPVLAAEMRAARSAGQTTLPDLRPIGWPVTAPPVAVEVLRDLSPRGAEALDLDWSERTEFHLDDLAARNVMYERVIREATRVEDLRSYLNEAVLRQVWGRLFLPARVRRSWKDRFPDLRRAA